MRSQSLQQISPDEYSSSIGETTSLRMPKRHYSKNPKSMKDQFVIRNQKVLKWLTRLVFLMLTLANIVVIAASVLLMQDCRHNLRPLKTLVPQSCSFCNNLGMPALFACCITIFTVFGLGCTGRKLTGYALIVISSVEILPGLTTLTFYQCDRMSHDQVLETINNSLTSCTIDAHVLWQESSRLSLESSDAMLKRMSSRNLPFRNRETRSSSLHKQDTAQLKTSQGFLADISNVYITKTGQVYDNSRIMNYNVNKDINFESLRKHPKHNQPTSSHLSMYSLPDSIKSVLIRDELCSLHSNVFKNIARRSASTTLNECIEMCGSYLSICLTEKQLNTPEPDNVTGKDGLQIGDLQIKNYRNKRGFNAQHSKEGDTFYDNNMLRPSHRVYKGTSVEKESISDQGFMVLKKCEVAIYKRVSHLCHYDNTIIIPLSVCSPVFNILMSVCFIYLAACDRKLKESLEDNGIIVQLTSDNKQNGNWLRRMFSSFQRMFRKKNSDSDQTNNYAYGVTSSSYIKQSSLCCLPYKGQLSELNLTEYSTSSTDESFHLKPMSSTNRASSLNSVNTLQSFITQENTPLEQ